MAEVSVKIPRASEGEVVTIPRGKIGDLKNHFDRQFDKIDKLLFAIVTSVIVSVIAVVVAVMGLFIDQLRYNNAAYKEYSEKIDTLETTQKTNEALLSQIQSLSEQNKKNQELTIEQQKQIKELLKK